MNAPTSRHPSDQTLSSYGLGKLDDILAEAVNTHLEACPDCRKRVVAMSSDSFLGRIRDAQADKSMFGVSQTDGTHCDKRSSAPPPKHTMPPGLADHPDYEIKRELGRGGMGVVYLAHNKLMGRDEVLKVMGRQIIERPGVLDRFLREIRAVAKLRHPNIVTAYSAVRLGESIVFAMEYVEGLDLSKMIKTKGPLPVAHACNFVYQSSLGLQHAYEEGLVHRDIKPGNLMLSRTKDKATVKVLDFGLAKVTREEKVDGGLTHQGQALGTPDFIAPEQIIDATTADIRADIYSLGCTLYYLLSGRPPFQSNSLYDIFQAHISRDADALNFVRPEVPAELAALVAKMMAKDAARRFQTPSEVAESLTPFFKKANAAFKSPKVDISQAGGTDVGQPLARTVSTPTQPATDAGIGAVRAKKAAVTNVAEARWDSLIEFQEEESPINAAPAAEPTSRPQWLWPSVAVGVLMLGLFAAWLGGVFKVKTPDGVIVLENLPKDAEVFVDGGKITLSWPGLGKPVEIRTVPGQRKLEVKKDGFSTFVRELAVKADGSEEITVRLDLLVDGPPTGKEAEANVGKADEPDKAPALQNEKMTTETDGGGLLTNADGAVSPMASRSPARLTGDLLQAGTVWKGLSTYVEPAGVFRDFVTELLIEKREGNRFEGLYAADRGAHTCYVMGTITDDKIEWHKTKGIGGGMRDDNAADWVGIMSHDRNDIKCNHVVTGGRPGRVNGFFLLQGDLAKSRPNTLGSSRVMTKRKSSLPAADTLLQADTVWKGLGGFVDQSRAPKDYVLELTIVRRRGNDFEAIYKADKGRVICEMTGAIADGSIELRVQRSSPEVLTGGRVRLSRRFRGTGSISSLCIQTLEENLLTSRACSSGTLEPAGRSDRRPVSGTDRRLQPDQAS